MTSHNSAAAALNAPLAGPASRPAQSSRACTQTAAAADGRLRLRVLAGYKETVITYKASGRHVSGSLRDLPARMPACPGANEDQLASASAAS